MKRQRLNALYLVIIVACYICHTEAVTGTCDRSSGPAGTVHCIQIPGVYYGYQWATCRTNTYIKTTSKGRHACIDSTRIYCYYQCMIDVYGRENGFVFPLCKCSPSDPPPTVKVPLPAWCYSPDGRSCNWYTDCLNKAYPKCEDDKDEYAIKFAEKFCKLYDKNYKDFSTEGKKWVDAVRKCLQVKLVPLIDTTREKSCAELKSEAFKTHTPCYLNPDQSSLSYCDLSIADQMTVFWTIKSAYIDAFGSSLKGMLEVLAGCIQAKTKSLVQEVKAKIQERVDKIEKAINPITDIIQETELRIKVWLEHQTPPIQLDIYINEKDWDKASKRRKRSVPDDREIVISQFAGKIVDALASEQKWKDKGVAWFAYANNETAHDNNTMSIRLLVADRSKYEGFDNSSLSLPKHANLTTTLVQLSEAILKGTLKLMIDGESIEIMKLNGCLDWNCEEHAFNITYMKAPESNGDDVKPKADECDAENGPDGARQCVKLQGYDDYQWATCRTDSYIKQTTNGKHYCRNPLHTYCLYQCMLDKYEESSGDVYGRCQCSGSQKATYTFAFVVLLAAVSSLLVL